MAKHSKRIDKVHRTLVTQLLPTYSDTIPDPTMLKLVKFVEVRRKKWLCFTENAGFEVQLRYQRITKDKQGDVVKVFPVHTQWFPVRDMKYDAWSQAEGLVVTVVRWIAEINTGKLDA